jgi:hypothetical protein
LFYSKWEFPPAGAQRLERGLSVLSVVPILRPFAPLNEPAEQLFLWLAFLEGYCTFYAYAGALIIDGCLRLSLDCLGFTNCCVPFRLTALFEVPSR